MFILWVITKRLTESESVLPNRGIQAHFPLTCRLNFYENNLSFDRKACQTALSDFLVCILSSFQSTISFAKRDTLNESCQWYFNYMTEFLKGCYRWVRGLSTTKLRCAYLGYM